MDVPPTVATAVLELPRNMSPMPQVTKLSVSTPRNAVEIQDFEN